WSGTEPISYSYSWQRCDNHGNKCGDVKGQTASTYVLGNPDVNHTLRVTVTAKNGEGQNQALSAVTGVVSAAPASGAPVSTAAPAISGTAQENQTLTASTGSWTGSGIAFSYTWEQCDAAGNGCKNIGGSNHSTYKVAKGDVGKTLRVAVTAKNAA